MFQRGCGKIYGTVLYVFDGSADIYADIVRSIFAVCIVQDAVSLRMRVYGSGDGDDEHGAARGQPARVKKEPVGTF